MCVNAKVKVSKYGINPDLSLVTTLPNYIVYFYETVKDYYINNNIIIIIILFIFMPKEGLRG